LVITN